MSPSFTRADQGITKKKEGKKQMALSKEEAIQIAVDVICKGLVNKNTRKEMTPLQRKLITLDGNIAAGKTTLLSKMSEKTGAKVLVEQAPKEILCLFYKAMKEKERTGQPNQYAALAQMFFASQRAQINQFGNALTGRTNDYGFPAFPWGEEASDVYTDRSRIGDLIFLLINWLSGDICDDAFHAIITASKIAPTFCFDVALYIDTKAEVAKARAEKRAAQDLDRVHESGIKLEYFEGLRKLHYIILRECAIRGAPIVCLSNETFLNADQVIEAITKLPSQEAITKIWSKAPYLSVDASPTEIDSAFSEVLKCYSSSVKMDKEPIQNPQIPYIEVIIAGMRGGKTTELIRRYGQRKATPAKIKIVKPKRDEGRFDPEAKGPPQVVAHNGFRKDCISVERLSELVLDQEKDEWVFIDEAQFFGRELLPFVLNHPWAKFVIAGLIAYSNLMPFGQLRDVLCYASEVTHLKAVCQFCYQQNAVFSPALRKKSRPDEVGASQYGSACHVCWSQHNVN